METTTQEESPAAKVRALLKDFSTVMLTTFDKTGPVPTVRARPMAVAKMDPDCTLWFITAIDSTAVADSLQTHSGHVVGQADDKWVSIQGSYHVYQDRERIHRLWSKAFDVWFPDGPDDPRACLMRFTPEEAEFWDASGTHGLRYLLQAAKSLVTKEPPKPDQKQHEVVKLS